MKKRENPVKSLKTIVLDSQNKFMIILMNWQSIVGKSNARIMMPFELKQKTLSIALPNNMVLSAISKFSALIMDKANLCAGEKSVEKLKFTIEPSRFKKTKADKTKAEAQTTDISEEEILQKKQELMTNFALEGNIAEIAAKIELTAVKRG